MDAMAEANADAKDLDDAIRIGFGSEDIDVEDELESLVKEAEEEDKQKQREVDTQKKLEALPDIPGTQVQEPRAREELEERVVQKIAS
jgi:charged multivesicular body protein 7